MGGRPWAAPLLPRSNAIRANATLAAPVAVKMRTRDAAGAFIASLLCSVLRLSAAEAPCALSVLHRDALYNFSLALPTPRHPHGVMSEDGFYKVAVNSTSLWFQLCDQMIFNHAPPRCFDCQDCGGPLYCGMKCSGLVANDIGGYFVCTTLGRESNQKIALIDENHPEKGVVVKMSAVGSKRNCSLVVSVFCNANEAHVPDSLDILGTCDYATVLRHPSGCARIISVNGKGLGWFGTLVIIIFCILGAYVLAGTIYRFFFLGIRGAEAVPNLDFWLSLPQKARSLLSSLVRRFRGQSGDARGYYASVNY